MAEIASAYLSIYPKLESKAVEREVTRGMASAGRAAGTSFSDNASKSMTSGMNSAGEAGAEALTSGFSAAQVAVGNIVSDIAENAVTELTSRFEDGIAQSDALQKFASTMEFAGFDTKQIEAVRTEMKDYADQTVYDLGEVMETTSKLAANGTEDFDTIVQAIGNLNAAAGGDSGSFGYLANAITQVNGAGVLMAQDWNQVVNALPGASGAIQQELLEMGAWDESMGTFKDALSEGEVTADEFNQALGNLGMTDVAQQAATSTTTFEGAMGQLDASVTNTMQGIYDGLNEDGRITDAINSLATAFETVAPYVADFADAFGDVIEFLSPAIPVIAGVVAGIAGFNALMGVAGMVTTLGTAFGALTTIITTFGGPIAALAAALGGLPVLIAAVVGGIIAFIATNEDARKAVVAFVKKVIATFKELPGKVAQVFNSVKTKVTTVMAAVQTAVAGKVKAIADKFSSGFSAIKGKVQAVFDGVKSAITGPIDKARELVSQGIQRIKDIFSGLHLDLPKPKLPHFRINGGKMPWGIGGKGTPPSVAIDWYARGGYVEGATLIGAGERGGEFIWPSYAPYIDQYADAIARHMPASGVTVNLDYHGTGDPDDLARAVTRSLQMMRMTGAI